MTEMMMLLSSIHAGGQALISIACRTYLTFEGWKYTLTTIFPPRQLELGPYEPKTLEFIIQKKLKLWSKYGFRPCKFRNWIVVKLTGSPPAFTRF
jgi:hypothetical protein